MSLEAERKLRAFGLSEPKIKETLKNDHLSRLLMEIHDLAIQKGEISKSTGIMLYNLGTKLPKQFLCHMPFLIDYIMFGKINQDAKLNAAIKFLQDYSSPLSFDCESFEKACGAGVEISQDDIEARVEQVINKHMDSIKEKRYQFNIGSLIGEVRGILKWADSKKVKEEFDLQLLTLLGPKQEYDILPSKGEKLYNKGSKHDFKNTSSDKSFPDNSDKPVVTMADLMKTVNFHKPGENHKSDGYVITENTSKLLKEHLNITCGQVRTRFPPEPNGILHIGHAKAININFGYAAAHNGVCFLRYDDTNPEKEEEKFFVGIRDMVEWLGYKPFKITHSSDYFSQLYEWAKELIKKGFAYVCHQKPEELKGWEAPLSPWRDRPAEESLALFEDMKNGKFDEGEATLRLKLTLEEGKVDPVAYRIKYVPHAKTGSDWCIYPTYDYTHCLCDSVEHITHSMCTKEFQNRRSSYYWVCNALNIYCPVQWEYGRLNMSYTVVSKRKICKLIDAGIVNDWDDPRLYTLTALRRRGVPPEAINNFVAGLGLTGAQITIHPSALDAFIRDTLNNTASRVMAILHPVKVFIINYNSGKKEVSVPNIPGNENMGSHIVFFDQIIWIEESDFKEVHEKGYRRLSPSQPVGLRHAGLIIELQEIVRNPDGVIDHLRVTCSPVSEQNKPKAFIHWVAFPLHCEIRLYNRLFLHENPEDSNAVPLGFLSDVNPNSLEVLRNSLVDISVKDANVFQAFQFERTGFFAVDPDSEGSDKIVFNRTVSLKEDKGKG